MRHYEMNQNLIKLYSKLRWLEICLLLFDIWLPYRLGFGTLPQIEAMHIACDWVAMFVMTVILNSCIHGTKTRASLSFMRLSLTIFLLLFLEVGIWAVDRLPGLRLVNYLCNIGCNSALLLSSMLYIGFVCDFPLKLGTFWEVRLHPIFVHI